MKLLSFVTRIWYSKSQTLRTTMKLNVENNYEVGVETSSLIK